MSKIKTIGASPLTGKIYQGTLDTEKGCWVGQKTDITESACRAVAEHMKVVNKPRAYKLLSGGFVVLKAEIVDKLPSMFVEVCGAEGGDSNDPNA